MIRLNRFLAHCGVSSRREAEHLIATGRIKVNDNPVRKQGVKIDPDRDRVSFDGVILNPEEKVYLIVNKPKGYMTTSSDPQKRPTVLDLLPEMEARVLRTCSGTGQGSWNGSQLCRCEFSYYGKT